MANNLKAIRKRIASVKNTKQITRAMKLVAGAKLRRATEAALAARPYNKKLNQLLDNLLSRTEDRSNQLLRKRGEVTRVGILAFSSDRGLCGSYNASVTKFIDSIVKDRSDNQMEFVAIGRKVGEHIRRKQYVLTRNLTDLAPKSFSDVARELGTTAVRDYEQGKVDEVLLVYQQFRSAMSQVVVCDQLLPLVVPEKAETVLDQSSLIDYIYEPTQGHVLDALLPQVVTNRIMKALLEANASEHAARMTAMDNATRNASELIDKLTLEANKARQAAITSELVEIVSGAEAL